MSSRVVSINLLRGFSVSIDYERMRMILSAERVLAFLALRGQPLARSYVAGALWPDTHVARAAANLRSSLHRIRQAGGWLIDSSAQQLCLAPGVSVDYLTAVERAHQILDSSPHSDDLLTSVTRYELSAELLPDWLEDDWVIVEREHFHHLRLHALESMCRRLTALGRYGEAIDAGLAAVEAEPLRESAHLSLIYAHLTEGNRSEARKQYLRCRHSLLTELGIEPTRAMRDLVTNFSSDNPSSDARIAAR